MNFARRVAWGLITIAVASLAACGDGLGPARRTIGFCDPVAPVAVQADGGAWTSAGTTASVTFAAKERVGIAIAYQNSNILELIFLSPDEAEQTLACPSSSQPPDNKTVNVSLRGFGSDEFANIATPGNSHLHASADFPLCCLPAQSTDIIAWKTHEPPGAYPTVPRMIIRRAQNPGDGSSLPTFDFGSDEAFTPAAQTLSIIGGPPGAPVFSQTDIRTAAGTEAMVSADSTSLGALVHHSVPAARLAAGDMHVIRLSDGARDITLFYNVPADRTVAFGPTLEAPAFSTVGSRLRVDAPLQQEYDMQFHVTLWADNGQSIVINASRAYIDAAQTAWSFTVPDLSSVPGFASVSTLPPTFGWVAHASSMPWTFRAKDARHGDFFRSATKFASLPAASGISAR